MTEDYERNLIIGALDSIRHREEAIALEKVRCLQLAAYYGIKPAEMAEAVGMSESGVRSALARAKLGPSEGGAR